MRLEQLTLDTLTPEQRELYDAIVGRDSGPSRNPTGVADAEGRLRGPFNAMLHNPRLGMPIRAANSCSSWYDRSLIRCDQRWPCPGHSGGSM